MYTLRKQKRGWLTLPQAGKMLAIGVIMAVGLVTGYRAVFVKAAPDPSIQVEALYPANNAIVNGEVTLKFTVRNLQPSQYEPFWAVDNGTWNRMAPDPNNPAVATATTNVSNWKWNSQNTYTISLIALDKASWQPVTTNVKITVGQTPAEQQAKAAAEAAAQAAKQAAQPAATPQTATASAPAPSPTLPVGSTLYANPNGDTARNANAQAAADPANAARLKRLASTPVAEWFGGWNPDVRAAADGYVGAAAATGQVPVLVAYNIPGRDCGSHSAGGTSPDAYVNWIRSLSAGIANRPAIVILEPDAVPQMGECGGQGDRAGLIGQAVSILKANPSARVYIDAGHANWHSPATIADRLRRANVARADGFSLNVSNFISTSESTNYGEQISRQVGGKKFVVDTSRNGNGATPDRQWCNPAGRALGQYPTMQTGHAQADAYLYIKTPGSSDGSCGPQFDGTSAPGAGVWWPSFALSLLRGAGW